MSARFVPTDEQRKIVVTLAATGTPQEDIARMIGCCGVVLRRDFRHELDHAAIKANAAVARTLFAMATSGKEPAATFFWLKCRAGWREVTRVAHSGELSLKDASDADLEREIRALRTRAAIARRAGKTEDDPTADPFAPPVH